MNVIPKGIEDVLRGYGIDPSQFIGETMDYASRVDATRAGVRFDAGDRLDVPTPYSSNVAGVRYDPWEDVLYIMFDNHREREGVRLYVYRDLLAHGFDATSIFAEIANSPSPGAAVWDRVRRVGAPFNRFG